MLTAGCSVLVESDREQCKTNEDCGKFESSFGYMCVENFCVSKPMCTVDADCTALGGQFAAGTCVENMCKPMCTVDADCTARGGDYAKSTCVASVCQIDQTWACVGKTRPAAPAGTPNYNVKLHLQHIVNMEPQVGVTARVCTKLDLDCTGPLETKVSDSNGDVELSIRPAFSGYVYLTRESPAIMPTLYFFNPPIDRDMTAPAAQIATPEIAGFLATRAGQGVTLRPDRGLLLMAGLDCLGVAKAGLTFKSEQADATVTPFYSSGGLPSAAAVETDVSGFGGFINAPPGVFSVAVKLEAEQKPLGSVSVQMKAGTLTIARFSPLGT